MKTNFWYFSWLCIVSDCEHWRYGGCRRGG